MALKINGRVLLELDMQKALLPDTAAAHVTAEWWLAQEWPLDWQDRRHIMSAY
jgi:hypothetical protein